MSKACEGVSGTQNTRGSECMEERKLSFWKLERWKVTCNASMFVWFGDSSSDITVTTLVTSRRKQTDYEGSSRKTEADLIIKKTHKIDQVCLETRHRRSQDFCWGGGTRPMPPSRCHRSMPLGRCHPALHQSCIHLKLSRAAGDL